MAEKQNVPVKINDIIKSLGYKILDAQEADVKYWEQLYAGDVKDFHEYKEYMGAGIGYATRKRKSMKMAKVVSELWADNIINPETVFTVGNGKWWSKYEEENNVYAKLNDLMEVSFALGTGFTVQNKDESGKTVNQYVTIKNALPLRVEFGEIKDIAFVSETSEGFYIQIHTEEADGYFIRNYEFDKNGKEIENEKLEKELHSSVKLWQMYTPAIVNNINVGNPLGISIYANATEELRSVDEAATSLDKEVRNGRMRVYIKGEALVFAGKDGKEPIFNKDQDEFYLLPEDDTNPDGTLVKVDAPTLRVNEFITNLEKQLNLLGTKCGLGDNAFYSQDGTIYTNTTQVVSTNSKFYKTRQKHIKRIENSLIEMIKALYYLDNNETELKESVLIEFDDTIIHDKEAEQNRVMQLFNAGMVSEVYVVQVILGLDEEKAKEFVEEQNKLKSNEEEPPEFEE